jgi:hypothetical protein
MSKLVRTGGEPLPIPSLTSGLSNGPGVEEGGEWIDYSRWPIAERLTESSSIKSKTRRETTMKRLTALLITVAVLAGLVAACAPTPEVVEKVVKETVMVEKEVEVEVTKVGGLGLDVGHAGYH